MSAPIERDGVDGPRAWIVAGLSFALCSVALGATIMVIVSLKEIAVTEGWPREAPSFVYAMTLTGAGLGGILMAWWGDKRGIRMPVAVGILGVGIGSILASRADTVWEMAAASGLLMGFLGTSAFFAPLLANATRWFERRRGLAVAMVAAGQNLAGAVWPPIVRLVTEEHGWRTTFLAYGVFTIVVLLPILPFIKGRPPAPKAAPVSTRASGPVRAAGLPPHATHFILFLMQVLCCLAMAASFVHGPAHVSDLGHSMATGAHMLSLVLASSIVSLLALGAIADRIGGLFTLMIASATQAVSLVLYANFESLSMLYASAVVFGLGFGGLVPSYAIVIREVFPVPEVGWRIASTFLGGTVGMATGGWLAGRIFDATGHYHDAFVLGFVFNVANLALALFLLPGWLRHRRAARAAA